MKRLLQARNLMLLLVMLLCAAFAHAQQYDKHVFRVKFKENSESALNNMNVRLSSNGVVLTGLSNVDVMSEKHKVVKMTRVFPYAGKYEAKHKKYGLHLWYEIEVQGATSIENAQADFRGLAEISTTELVHAKNNRVAEVSAFKSKLALATLPDGTNDPNYKNQWHYENTGQTGGVIDADIDLDNAWTLETGSRDVIVSIHDEGVDFDHEDLAGNMWVNTGEIPNNGIDDDNNGFIDDIYGYNFAQVKGAITPGNHGTHVAGTVAAESNNGIGGSGVAGGTGEDDGVRLMSCQVFSSTGSRGFSASYVYAADNGAVISQNSWGYTVPGSYEQSVLDAIRYFIAEAGYDENGNQVGPMAGGIVIFAAGNDADDDQYFPGYMEEVIAVAGTNHKDEKYAGSNHGAWIDIAAPGENIFSTLINNQYSGVYTGTSMACPHVSGVAALIVSRFKDEGITPDQVRSRLINTTDKLSFEGFEDWGTGRVNAYKALADNDGAAPVAISDLLLGEITDRSITLSWTAPNDLPNSTQVTTYDLRYSTQPIDATNFADATRITIKKPSAPGAGEIVLVDGLLPATTFYFAIVSADYFGNTSTISNVVSGTTEDAPTIAVNGDPSVSIDVSTADKTATGSFTIQNIGGYPLIYDILPVYGGIVETDTDVASTLMYPVAGAMATMPALNNSNVPQIFYDQPISGSGSLETQLNFENKNKDVLAYDDGNNEVFGSLKVTNQSGTYINWTAATLFEVPAMEDHFVLSQVKAYMQVSYEAASLETLLYIIEGGDTPLEGTTRLVQAIDNKEGSKFWDINLEIPVAFESGDKFWIAFVFPEEPVELGYDKVSGGNRPNTHMAYMNQQWVDIQSFEGYAEYVWAVRAIENTVDGLTLSINQGVLEPMGSQNVQVTYDATDVVRNADYDFDLYIVSNDPVNPLKIVDAKATIIGLLEPEMVVTPESITTTIDVAVNPIKTETITISNTGDGDLEFDFENIIDVPKVSIAAVSDYVTLLDVPVSDGIAPNISQQTLSSTPVATYSDASIAYAHQIHPTEFFVTFSTDAPQTYTSQGGNIGYNVLAGDFTRGDETNMYIINDETETLMKLNVETGERTIIGPTVPFNDITTDKFENIVYGTNFNGATSDLYKLDVKTGEAELIGSMGDGIMVAIAVDGDGKMWGFKLNDGNIYAINKQTGAASPVGHVGFTANFNQSMSWDPKSGIVYLSAFNYIEERGELRVVDTNTGATELIGVFPGNSQVSAMAFPGGGYEDFASASPARGTVAPSSSVEVTVTIDATELPNGGYFMPLTISTNDYDHLTQVVPVALEVTGQIGTIDVDNQIMDFGAVLLGASKEIHFSIGNTGIGNLDITSITSSNPLFTSNFTEVTTIAMEESVMMTVKFKPVATGQFNSTLTINSNDPHKPQVKITMTGSAILPPEIVIEPDTVAVTLNSGDIVTREFTIKNVGAYPLQYSMSETQVNTVGSEQNESGVALHGIGGPDGNGYRWIDSNDPNGPVFVWNDISATGTEKLINRAFGLESVTLPFGFPFYGANKTSMNISAEGYLTFGTGNSTLNRTIPDTATPNDLIAVFWDNLRFPNTMGKIYYQTFADRVIVQWDQVGNTNTTDETISFQAVLYKDGRMMMYYNDVTLGIRNAATIGVENADGTEGVEVNFNESYVESELAVLIFPGYKGFDNVSVNNTSGIIAPGEEETVEVTISAEGLWEGTYSNEVYIYNNDPVTPKAQFTSVITVIGHPEINVNKYSLSFDPIIENTSSVGVFSIENRGSKDLTVSNISSDNASFTTSFTGSKMLGANEKMSVEVTFAPTSIGTFTGNITITSDDDFGNSSIIIPVTGSAIASPAIGVSTEIDPFEVTLNSGESETVGMTIQNTTGSRLNYVVHAPSFATIDGAASPSNIQGGDQFGYTWTDSDSSSAVTYNWVDIADRGVRLPLGEANGIFVSFPFTFPYYGNTYSEVQVASNGFLTFGTALGSSGGSNNGNMPSASDPDNHIAILWDDLDPAEMGDVYYLATPDSLVVQYTNVIRDNSAYTATFQGILYANGDIKMQYKDLDNYTQNNSVTIGIENEDGSDGFAVIYNKLGYLKSELAVMITSPFHKGSLEVGESENLDLVIDTQTIYDGVYTESIRVVSNDASNSVINIPATLTVIGTQAISLDINEIEFDTLHFVEGQDINQVKAFTIYNEGTKALTVGPLAFSETTTAFEFDRNLPSYDIAPKDSLLVKVRFMPESEGEYTSTLNIPSNDATTPVVSVVLEGVSLLPPQAVVSTLDTLKVELLTTGTIATTSTLSNEGFSDLDYTTHVKYYPNGGVASGSEFGDTIRYDVDEAPSGYYGQNGVRSTQIAVQFTLETEKFYLTHISNFYDNNGAYEPSLLQIWKGGTRPSEIAGAELITSQQFAHAEANGGYDAIIALEEPQLFYADEDAYFWVVITYPNSMLYPAAYNDRSGSTPRASWLFPTNQWVNAQYNFKMRALEQVGGYGDWLTIDPAAGTVEPSASTELSHTIDASGTHYGGKHYAVVTYNFNDPLEPSLKRAVELTVNHLPEVEVLENIYVSEGGTVNIVAKASDVDGSIASIVLLQEYPFTTIAVADNTATITYSPDFDQAGTHVIELVVTDNLGEAMTQPITITVGDVNRTPIAGSFADVNLYLNDPLLTINGSEVFTDEDADELTFRAEIEDEDIATVNITTTGFEITPSDIGTTSVVLYATDGMSAEVSVSFELTIDAVLAIGEKPEGGIHAYPNPFVSTVNVKLDSGIKYKTIRLLNSVGKVVYYATIPVGKTGLHEIDFSAVSSGVYHLQLISDKGIFIEKVIKK